ncbi:hypothetical protein EVB32_071 [Rhizobium phage RHph_TM39]|uniref:Uncharacterized protein n=2 Tax=Cuauhnahuacvirus TaxID=3044696 RepID=A0A7S5R7N7_9CAUD|nr:hypothetical protein PQC16_gp071 [Rhizobium phage RHph_TM30]YP_010671218.1 hypothetical protein PQC17_gp069 [Rhizobium phage RHph_Y65]QIG71542.1 hypothetical protein EVB94_071 [Rhizobium phage RHph_TM40]QIG71905.1 hypothetical protein EVB95_071 [Rhizobium phage RHph_TM2_3B]QIG72267.1 hypothetical protein EVB96_071 [Rhizobium phage RHph_TM3_3_6]QIG77059.1 hypothetical protein EVB32_071 [Rhizobium phage RHph_TM39]QIG77399.1 hypothetical protein EVB61_071 [Rhizobium phage RHph_TM21B]QIG77658
MSAVVARLKSIDIDNTDNLFSGAFKLLIAGVGFRTEDNKFYEVFSHYGDYCGKIPTYMVNSLQAHLKRQYQLLSEKIPYNPSHERDNLTYGWMNLVPFDKVEDMMEFYADKPLEIA